MEVSYKLISKKRYSFVVAKANPSLPIVIDPILQATYLGGSGGDEAYTIAVYSTTGEVYVAEETNSNDFPCTSSWAHGRYSGGIVDTFVARLTSDLTAGSGSSGEGGGCSMTGSASSMAGLWNILVWLSVPFFALARRIRRR